MEWKQNNIKPPESAVSETKERLRECQRLLERLWEREDNDANYPPKNYVGGGNHTYHTRTQAAAFVMHCQKFCKNYHGWDGWQKAGQEWVWFWF